MAFQPPGFGSENTPGQGETLRIPDIQIIPGPSIARVEPKKTGVCTLRTLEGEGIHRY